MKTPEAINLIRSILILGYIVAVLLVSGLAHARETFVTSGSKVGLKEVSPRGVLL